MTENSELNLESNSKDVPIQIEQTTLRENLINTATEFLKNPNVLRTKISQQKAFLISKGLTSEEINEAFRRIGENMNYPKSAGNMQIVPKYIMAEPPSLFIRIRDGLQTVTIFSAFIYGVYKFFKTFILPFLFNDRKKKPKSIEDRVDELKRDTQLALENINVHLVRINENFSNINQDKVTSRQINELKNDINNVKGLLLSRKSFPPIANNSGIVPPSIPAWQLSSQRDEESAVDKEESGSGSGSSETEVVTKNSDSSIEIM